MHTAVASLVITVVGAIASAPWSPTYGDTVRVAPGDTLTSLAARYHTTVTALALANGVTDRNFLLIGTVLNIPGSAPDAWGGAAPAPTAAPTAGPTAGGAMATTTVVVRSGDTLSSIASRNHTTVAAIVSANHLTDPNFVLIGTRLAVPVPAAALASYLAPLPSGSLAADTVRTRLLAHPERLALRPAFVRAAAASGLPPNLLEALCWWESGWQNSATSSTGAMGVCQLEPSTVGFARATLLHNPGLDPRVGADNIAMAAAYLHDLTVRSGGSLNTAIAGYYQGLPSVQKKGLLASTQMYVRGILGYATIFPPGG